MRFILTAGGTAGHINPALSVAEKLNDLYPGSSFLFIGAEGKMECELVPRAGYDFRAVKVTNLSRGHSAEDIKHNLETARNAITSVKEASNIIKEFKPDAVIGTGGYVCFPVITAAHRLGVPTVVHESNAEPGLTTKLLADKADLILVGVPECANSYRRKERVHITGTPVRAGFCGLSKAEARKQLGIEGDKPLVVSAWGSLGARHMNETVLKMIPRIAASGEFLFIHSIGSYYYDSFMKEIEKTVPDWAEHGIDLRKYIYDMPLVMTAADLITCRAGASTLAELSYIGKPALIVPSPNVTNNHQEKNARVLEKAGGAEVLLESEFTEESFFERLRSLVSDSDKLDAMGKAMRSLCVEDSAERICSCIASLL